MNSLIIEHGAAAYQLEQTMHALREHGAQPDDYFPTQLVGFREEDVLK